MKTWKERLGKEWLFFDGGMGTILQENGLKAGELPETWNISHPDAIQSLHRAYLEAGADIINTNTFGANGLKYKEDGEYSLKHVIESAVALAKRAREETGRTDAYIALDIGPTGKLLKPMGDLAFEDAYELFKEVVLIGTEAGADLILIETMSDTYEAKAAVLAAKENSSLPVIATMIFGENGKLLTGADPAAVVALLEGLSVDALGMNCGLGPAQMKEIVGELVSYASIPVVVNPNAGLPRTENGRTVFDVGPEEFAEVMEEIAGMGVQVLGGCCGTTPTHIKALRDRCKERPLIPPKKKNLCMVSSYSHAVMIGNEPVIIGERINPTGKKKLKEALREKNMEYILNEGLTQEEKGAHILDVNVGLPEIDEPEMMEQAVTQLQAILDLPLQIDTSNMEAMERAMRCYNGKPMINSVNGKKEIMDAVFPLVKKYGGVVVGLALDETGIPDTAEGRVKIAEKIYSEAEKYGIERKDIVIDALAMTISSDTTSAGVTLETLKRIRDEYHGNTILGVSNISFGLPKREIINAAFYTMAMQNGLSCAIINPNSEDMMRSYHAYLALAGLDEQCSRYIEAYGGQAEEKKVPSGASKEEMPLFSCIEKGLKEKSAEATRRLAEEKEPLAIIDEELIPALDHVGKGFEKGTVFLPQLLMSAEAAKAAFEVLKQFMERFGTVQEKKGKIILATVKGDIHDIGKNIVKVLLENYSYDVIDLGKDVSPETIVQTAIREDVKLVGLSALMTTTVVNMEETIRQLRTEKPDTKIVVGGAVLTKEYAESIGADCYAKDAMATVHYAQEVLG
ncbi:MAG TPA: homocysteine S-methyltransferase family protein [Candidatus Fimimorpha excrementavium]|nr:homocysteine S-methyltransferase family protein [Candidatus Fimimorpha excrementavium]